MPEVQAYLIRLCREGTESSQANEPTSRAGRAAQSVKAESAVAMGTGTENEDLRMIWEEEDDDDNDDNDRDDNNNMVMNGCWGEANWEDGRCRQTGHYSVSGAGLL
jgi:hypothetical protein